MKYGTIQSSSISASPIRQTVLRGSTDGNGFPNALTIGAGLSVTLSAASTPFLLSFAAGFDSYGSVDYVDSFTANQSFSGLTASSGCYLYVDRNPVTDALTSGFSTLAPLYAESTPFAPAVDQHWFDSSSFTMRRWSGSAWVVCQRVFVGDCVTGAATVNSVTNFAYRRRYRSTWLAVAAQTTYNFNHNVGLPAINGTIGVWTSIAGNDSDAILATPTLTTVAGGLPTYNGYQAVNSGVNNRKTFPIFTGANVALNSANGWVTSAFYKVIYVPSW